MHLGRVARSLLLLAPWLLISSDFTAEKYMFSTFTLVVEGVEDPVGEIRIAVFDSENRYLDEPSYAEIVPVSDTMIEWQIDATLDFDGANSCIDDLYIYYPHSPISME